MNFPDEPDVDDRSVMQKRLMPMTRGMVRSDFPMAMAGLKKVPLLKPVYAGSSDGQNPDEMKERVMLQPIPFEVPPA